MHFIFKNKQAQFALIFFCGFFIWWGLIQFGEEQTSPMRQLFAALYGLIALWGGVWGLIGAKKWGGLKSVMGRSLIAFSLGLFAQEFGQLSYSYYIYYLHQEVPYPSIGDIGYFLSIPLYLYGAWLLGHVAGVKLSLKSVAAKLQVVVIPVAMVVASYFIFLQGYEYDASDPMKVFLDFGYPFGEAVYISFAVLALLLSRKFLGGILRPRIIFIITALFVQYVADFTFLYQAQRGWWYAGGVNDLIYLIAYVCMTLALMEFDGLVKRLRAS